MDKAEARDVLLQEVMEPLRELSYLTLVERFVGHKPEHFTVEAPSGYRYNVELQGVWDEGKPGPLRVLGAIDDGSKRAWVRPLCEDFIKAEDNSFVGE